MIDKKNTRNSSLELLRIIAMLFIVFSHYCFYSGVDILNLSNILNKSLLEIFFLGNLGSCIFFVISGYFIFDGKYSVEKIVKLILVTTFYSILIYTVLLLFNVIDFSILGLVKALLPIIFEEYWFITVYILLYLLSPFIIKLVNSISKRDFIMMLILLTIVWSIIPTFTSYYMYGEPLGRSLLAFLFGLYLHMYPNNCIASKDKAIAIICGLLIILSVIGCNVLSLHNSIFNHGTMFLLPPSFAILFLGVSLFSIFSKKEFKNKYINTVSGCVFGVYLIHNNPNLVRYIFDDIVKVYNYINSPFMFVHMIVSVISIYIICIIIELIRIKTLGKIFDNISKTISKCILRIFKKLTKSLE